jgi:serine/threonine protein kinase
MLRCAMGDSRDLSDYVIVKQIGSGATSVVYHAICKHSNMPVALKIYKKRELGPLNKRQVEREIEIHAMIHHDNIVHLVSIREKIKDEGISRAFPDRAPSTSLAHPSA